MRRLVQPLPSILNPGDLIIGDPVTGEPIILSKGSIGDSLLIDGSGNVDWGFGGGGGGGFTFSDTGSINFSVAGAVVTADAIFGSIAGTVAEGNHSHGLLHNPVTVTDSASVDLTLVGQDITATAIFGSTATTVAAGNHAHANDHVAATVLDSTSIDLSITGQQISAAAIFGSTATTIAVGNHTHSYQPLDSELTTLAGLASVTNLSALAGLTGAADRVPYFTGAGTMTITAQTAFARSILDDVDAAAVRGTLGLGDMATQSAAAVAITGGSVTGITDLLVADGGTGASTASAARTNLGLVIGTDVAAVSHIHSTDYSYYSMTEDYEAEVVTALKFAPGGGGTENLVLASDHPGVWQVATTGTTGNLRKIMTAPTATSNSMFSLATTTTIIFEALFRIETITTVEFFFGLCLDPISAANTTNFTAATNSVGFQYDSSGTVTGTTNWAKVMSFATGGSPVAYVNTAITPTIAAGRWVRMMVERAVNQTDWIWTLWQSSATLGSPSTYTFTGPGPTTGYLSPVIGWQTRSGAIKNMNIDFARIYASPMNRSI